ncbi:hypothetical protein [Suttonella ornithocola]|uniref:DUF1640 domain-containing protein n=1 Tax=Suttonella ornithocola TaxID=279832 RepID=A0A380MZ52_9GAMM|nr:hypothetical protein [Suttonella ornithocola]SUO96747.1 Uncharacterised protein [Suttonella ornithocola]
MYNTVEYQAEVAKLVAVEFTREQAEAIMQHVEDRQIRSLQELATKRQLEDVRIALKQEVADVRTELKQEIANVKHDIEKLDQKMDYKFRLLTVLMFIAPFAPEALKQLKIFLGS